MNDGCFYSGGMNLEFYNMMKSLVGLTTISVREGEISKETEEKILDVYSDVRVADVPEFIEAVKKKIVESRKEKWSLKKALFG